MATKTSLDYSNAIVIPTIIPHHLESHYAALKCAKRIIHILSLFARGAETFEYMIQHDKAGKLTLPKHYDFDGFKIRFLPGWGTYSVVLEDGVEISIKIPHGKDEFERDLEMIGNFLHRYYRLPNFETPYREPKRTEHRRHHSAYPAGSPPLPKRQQSVINFTKKLRELDR